MTPARLRRIVLLEIYSEPYVYRRANLYAAIAAEPADIDAAIRELVASGELYADADELSLTAQGSHNRGVWTDERRARKEHRREWQRAYNRKRRAAAKKQQKEEGA